MTFTVAVCVPICAGFVEINEIRPVVEPIINDEPRLVVAVDPVSISLTILYSLAPQYFITVASFFVTLT